jgi:Endoplasmic Reticulum-Golgi Intermediate Compartment (ERGIC)
MLRRYIPRALDIFPKAKSGAQERSAVSGLFSSLGAALAVILVVGELASFVSPPVVAELGVDLHTEESHAHTLEEAPGGGRKIAARRNVRLNLDVRFPGLPCSDFGLDYSDALGQLSLGVREGLEKIPYDPTKLGPSGASPPAGMVPPPNPTGKGCILRGYVDLSRVKGSFHVAFGKKAEAMGGSHIHRYHPPPRADKFLLVLTR